MKKFLVAISVALLLPLAALAGIDHVIEQSRAIQAGLPGHGGTDAPAPSTVDTAYTERPLPSTVGLGEVAAVV